MDAETARKHELNYVLEQINAIRFSVRIADIHGVADDLAAWLRSRLRTNVANEPRPTAESEGVK